MTHKHSPECEHYFGAMYQADLEFDRKRGHIICRQCWHDVDVVMECSNCGHCTACSGTHPGHISGCPWEWPGERESFEAGSRARDYARLGRECSR